MLRNNAKVLVVFSDNGLGGTSRSALTSCFAWKLIGYNVIVCATKGVTPSRENGFASQGLLVNRISDICWDNVEVVHFHYSSYSSGQQSAIDSLTDAALSLGSSAPKLVVSNIFAIPDGSFKRWPVKWCTTVLGDWAAMQYRLSDFGLQQKPFVVGNGQDSVFFRPPSAEERKDARKRIGIPVDERVILRIGSPHQGKWSKSYLRLADACRNTRMKMILVGAPAELSASVRGNPRCMTVERVDDDNELRELYWASDCFALDAIRGESFGNVILEALGSGLPVVYRARELRDNTPWEFRSLPGFSYVTSKKTFIKEATRICLDYKQVAGDGGRLDGVKVAADYSIGAISSKLKTIVDRLNESVGAGKVQNLDCLDIPATKFIKSFILHNPFGAYLKQVRLEVRSKWRR